MWISGYDFFDFHTIPVMYSWLREWPPTLKCPLIPCFGWEGGGGLWEYRSLIVCRNTRQREEKDVNLYVLLLNV